MRFARCEVAGSCWQYLLNRAPSPPAKSAGGEGARWVKHAKEKGQGVARRCKRVRNEGLSPGRANPISHNLFSASFCVERLLPTVLVGEKVAKPDEGASQRARPLRMCRVLKQFGRGDADRCGNSAAVKGSSKWFGHVRSQLDNVEDDLAVNSENLAVNSENLAVDCENLAVNCENLAVDCENLAVDSENLAVVGENLADDDDVLEDVDDKFGGTGEKEFPRLVVSVDNRRLTDNARSAMSRDYNRRLRHSHLGLEGIERANRVLQVLSGCRGLGGAGELAVRAGGAGAA